MKKDEIETIKDRLYEIYASVCDEQTEVACFKIGKLIGEFDMILADDEEEGEDQQEQRANIQINKQVLDYIQKLMDKDNGS
jgi:hypothetical protein